jgi:Protein of unknown function (DUF2934)
MTDGEKNALPEESVKARAYALWEEEGRPDGKHLEHWRRAASETASELAPAPALAPTKAPPARRNGKGKA